MSHFQDEITGTEDRRLILRAEEWIPVQKLPGKHKLSGSTLVIACGDRMLNDNGRTIFFIPGELIVRASC